MSPSPSASYHLIDVRTPAEFSSSEQPHLPNAVNIPHDLIGSRIDQLPEISKDGKIDLYCRSGRRSGIAKKLLEEMGYTCVRDLGALDEARSMLETEQEA